MVKKRTHEDYLQDLKSKDINNIIVVDKYINSATDIKHQCLICEYEFNKSPNRVFNDKKYNRHICPYCGNRVLIVGHTDLWTTIPNIAKLLLNPKDGYKYTKGSDVKLDWKCPDCNTIIRGKNIHNTISNGLSCPICNDGLSFGHKYVCALLEELGINYINEMSFNWSCDRRYDLYLIDLNSIIEVHGCQHYKEISRGRSLEEEQENDQFKEHLANKNNISKYIVIDCREDDYEWQTSSIINSLSNIFDLSDIDFKMVYNNSLKSYVLKVCELWNSNFKVSEISNILKISDVTVQRYLAKGTLADICNYRGVEEKNIKVVCLNTGEVFENLNLAGERYNIDPNGISFVCAGKRNRKTAGKLEDGTKLTWQYYENYIKENKALLEKSESAS
jgi:DNA-directed RNA polymerase subunit RPC12/RpoP